MPFAPRLPAQIQDFVAGAKAAMDSFFFKAAEIAEELRERLQFLLDKLPGRGISRGIRPVSDKRRVFLIALMGGIAIILLICIGTLISKKKPAALRTAGTEEVIRQGFIPSDELFLPDEPDFVPGVILEREQRAAWTVGDAETLWQDPLKDGEEPWRNRIERAIDEIMEGVP